MIITIMRLIDLKRHNRPDNANHRDIIVPKLTFKNLDSSHLLTWYLDHTRPLLLPKHSPGPHPWPRLTSVTYTQSNEQPFLGIDVTTWPTLVTLTHTTIHISSQTILSNKPFAKPIVHHKILIITMILQSFHVFYDDMCCTWNLGPSHIHTSLSSGPNVT